MRRTDGQKQRLLAPSLCWGHNNDRQLAGPLNNSDITIGLYNVTIVRKPMQNALIASVIYYYITAF